MTLPTTPRGTAKVLAGRGVKIHYIYYWSDLFHDPEVEGRQVPVRYDPLNSGTAFAFVKDQWVQCHSEYYAVFQGHSEREMMLATQELRQDGDTSTHRSAISLQKRLAISFNPSKSRNSYSLSGFATCRPERHAQNRTPQVNHRWSTVAPLP